MRQVAGLRIPNRSGCHLQVADKTKNSNQWIDRDHEPRVSALGSRQQLGAGLSSADRHGSVQVVSSTNGELANDDPTTGQSNTPIAGVVEVDVVSETK